jgi:[ribosomal protein S5]-alanine N-acetyltransferase
MPDPTNPSDDALVLRTGRLVLRPSRVEDAPLLFEHCSDPRVPRYMTWAPHRELGETKTFLESCVRARRAGTGYTWCIFEDEGFRGFIGLEGIVRQVLAVRYDRGELGYWLGLSHHGRGLMTEAAGAVAGCAFARLGLHKVTVRAFAQNTASLRVIEKLGFTRVGFMRRDVWRDGVWHDQIVFEMLADSSEGLRLQQELLPA